MNFNQLLETAIVVLSVAAVFIASIYSKHKIEIDRKAAQGDLLAKSEQLAARSVTPLVYQAEKRGGSGEDKLEFVISTLNILLTMAHLPSLPTSFLKGLAEKSVTAMKQAQSIADTVDKPNKTITASFGQDTKTEQSNLDNGWPKD